MMVSTANTYSQYFDVDENYFPCFDDSAINAGADWSDTYPHADFVALLSKAEYMLSGTSNRSLWVHGSYGTGKSKCVYALKKILDVPEDELRDYWDRYANLRERPDLLNKIIGHKRHGVVTAFRYASGGITTIEQFFFAIQESISAALKANENIHYYGEETLKEAVISWLSDPVHKDIFNLLLKRPKWSSTFSQSSADEVIAALKSGNAENLMTDIFQLASDEKITAMSFDADMLKKWIKDVIEKNKIKIVFIWDEFSHFFKQNRNSLDEFQKVVALCQEAPFYLMVVTHKTDSISNSNDQSWTIVQQRFNFVQISLPDNLAFELIANAFSPKEAARAQWDACASELNNRLGESRKQVMTAAGVEDSKIIEGMLPIHPMSALVLKNIAAFFQSNQRSMFDFIKDKGGADAKAFQWFIENTSPYSEYPLLTIDMLWGFFYEKGKDSLPADIRLILDTFSQQRNLNHDEQRVLKTVLIMEAIDKRLTGNVELLKPTDRNLTYAFEGTQLEQGAKAIANILVSKGILVKKPLGNGKHAYGVAVYAGDQGRIDEYKKQLDKTSTTEKLAAEGEIGKALRLPPALSLRLEPSFGNGLIAVTVSDFKKVLKTAQNSFASWQFSTLLAVAKDETEASAFRNQLDQAFAAGNLDDFIIIDALSSPLGDEDYNQYIEFAAMAQYYQGSNNASSTENERKRKQVLTTTWFNKIHDGILYVRHVKSPEGERASGADAVYSILEDLVLQRYRYLLDFKGLNSNQLKDSQTKSSAKCALVGKTSNIVAGIEKKVLGKIWMAPSYWEDKQFDLEPISIVKKQLEEQIQRGFSDDGRVGVKDLWLFLQSTYGYAPSNLSAFLFGFLLKEYSGEPFRFSDSSGSHEPMTQDKLAEMISNSFKEASSETYIVVMTPEERAFYELTESVWGIPSAAMSSISSTSNEITKKMHELGLPIWTLKEVDEWGAYCVVEEYINLIQAEGGSAHTLAVAIGRKYQNNPSISKGMISLITRENCRRGMLAFLARYNGGKLISLAREIGLEERMLGDIAARFSVSYANLWNQEVGEGEIESLYLDYQFVDETTEILGDKTVSKDDALGKWTSKLHFVPVSCESLKEYLPSSASALDYLHRVVNGEELTAQMMRQFVSSLHHARTDLKDFFENEETAFLSVYQDYVEDLKEEDVVHLKNITGLFALSKTDANARVKNAFEEFKKGQKRTQLSDIWKSKTGTKSPLDWSEKHRTPIGAFVPKEEYSAASAAFKILNGGPASDKEIDGAISYLKSASFYDSLDDPAKIDQAFIQKVIGSRRAIVLTDIEKVRDKLEKLSISTFEWDTHPSAQDVVWNMAKAEYNSGGSDAAERLINEMDFDELRKFVIEKVKKDMGFGLALLNGRE